MPKDSSPEKQSFTASTLLRRPTRLGDEVYNAIYAQLMSHKIAPGGRISVDNLVRELGVSQTPIREALSRLETQGLVVKRHLVGYSAADQLNKSRLEQLYELRLLLEPFAAAKAAVTMTDASIETLESLAQEMKALEAEDPQIAYGQFAQRDSEFHDLIAAGSGNELVREALANLHTHVHLFRLFYHSQATAEANDEHAQIIAALRGRDAEAAAEAMRSHIVRSSERFATFFTRYPRAS
ncbi:Transcriptional regulator, GntR family [Bosea sp. LC85]|uniref:GntR family transcriptional regulator n=1 Tax=Bosea sp. LC85 TaxID=1502851 RepID=UPI0004E41DBE|nr:GntR family transcriptional regulator [Bosea sp. LC85]KFC64996.1 Transcriptional regulator, GntR family [Bosea sp. LC85]